jgi:hypothetical protein
MVMRRYVGWWEDISSHWPTVSFDDQAAIIAVFAGGVEAMSQAQRLQLAAER